MLQTLAPALLSVWQNHYLLLFTSIGMAILISLFFFLKKKKKHQDEEMETPVEIHLRGELLPSHAPQAETKIEDTVKKALAPQATTVESKSLSSERIKKKMPTVAKKKIQQIHKKESAPKKALPKKKLVVAKVPQQALPAIAAPLPATAQTSVLASVSKDKKPTKKKTRVHSPNKPIGEVIPMPAKEIKTEAPRAQTVATV